MTSLRAFVKKLMQKEQSITVVSGLPRSGTSMMMAALQAGGMDLLTDGFRSADSNNPRGYYEFERAKKLPEGDTAWLYDAVGKAVKIISALLEYLPAGYNYRVIFMQRDMEEILSSQRRMLERNRVEETYAVSDEDLYQSYQSHLDAQRLWLDKQTNFSVFFTDFKQILQQPKTEFTNVAEFLGQRLDVEAMVAIVDPSLYRERK